MDDPIVLIDARNVLRSCWPNLDEKWFLDRVAAWAERECVTTTVVFDGRIPVEVLDTERVSVVGTGTGTADDWIAERAPALAPSRGCGS